MNFFLLNYAKKKKKKKKKKNLTFFLNDIKLSILI